MANGPVTKVELPGIKLFKRGKVRDVPFRPIRAEQPDAVASLDAKLGQPAAQSRDPAQHFVGRNRFPLTLHFVELGPRRGALVNRFEKAFRYRGIRHRVREAM